MEKTKKIKIFIGLSYLILISIFMFLFFSKFSFHEITSYNFIKENSTKMGVEKSSDFECQFCTKTFASVYSLKRHISICKLNISQKKISKTLKTKFLILKKILLI